MISQCNIRPTMMIIVALLIQANWCSNHAYSQELATLVKKWRTIEPICTYTLKDEIDKDDFSEVISKDGVSITFVPHPDSSKNKTTTTITAPVLNLPGGLQHLRPLVRANQSRFDNMMAGRGLKTEALPGNLSVRIQIVHAYADSNGSVFFQSRTEFVRGRAISVSEDFELWKFSDEGFHLLSLPTQWSEGG